MKNNIKAVIFDFDGTVADTIWAIREAVNSTRSQLGFSELDYEGVKAGINRGARNLVLKTVVPPDRLDDNDYIDNAVAVYHKAYNACYTHTDKPYDGVYEAVHELKRRGFRLGMLSNKPNEFVRTLADNLFGEGTFEVARGPVDSKITKPDPRLTFSVIAELDPLLTPDECVFVGDSEVDLATARNAGITFIGVAWGYRGREFLEANAADYIVDHPSELTALFN